LHKPSLVNLKIYMDSVVTMNPKIKKDHPNAGMMMSAMDREHAQIRDGARASASVLQHLSLVQPSLLEIVITMNLKINLDHTHAKWMMIVRVQEHAITNGAYATASALHHLSLHHPSLL